MCLLIIFKHARLAYSAILSHYTTGGGVSHSGSQRDSLSQRGGVHGKGLSKEESLSWDMKIKTYHPPFTALS